MDSEAVRLTLSHAAIFIHIAGTHLVDRDTRQRDSVHAVAYRVEKSDLVRYDTHAYDSHHQRHRCQRLCVG